MADVKPEPVEIPVLAGMPLNMSWRLTGGKNIWATADLFEVRSHLRTEKLSTSSLIRDLSQYMTPVYDDDDIVIYLEMTGADTRNLSKGYYDLFLSDVGSEDAKAIFMGWGQMLVSRMTTTAVDDD